MKNISSTYRLFTKVTALLLLMAFLIPTGLHAKQFVDFCMMEMANHSMAASASSHNNCHPEPAEEEKPVTQNHHEECDWDFVCACNIGQSQLGDEEWIPASKYDAVQLTETVNSDPFFTSSETIRFDQNNRIGLHNPPLWLLYDTFLM